MPESSEVDIWLGVIDVIRETEDKFEKETEKQTRADLSLVYGMATYTLRTLRMTFEDRVQKAKLARTVSQDVVKE